MPVYEVTQDSTGITLELEGDTPPTQQQVEGAFKQYASQNPPQKSYFDRLTENVMGQAPEPVELTQAPAAPIQRPEGFPEDTLTGRPTFQERMQRPEIKSKIFPALAALEQEVTENLTRQYVTKPAGSRIEREGVMAPFAASPEKREVFKEAFQSVGRVIGPKTEAASGVVGEAVADLLTSPGGIATVGIGTGLRSVASIPKTLQAVEGGATASDLMAAAKTARTAQALEKGAVLAFAEPTAESAVISTKNAIATIDSNAPAEDKVRATTEAALSLLFTGLLGAGAKESFGKRTGLTASADAMEAMAGRQIEARDAAANLKRMREDIAFAEATLPQRGAETISPQEMQADLAVRARLAETKALMDRALNEAVQARVIDTGELTAIEQLRAQGTEVIAPERIGEGTRTAEAEPTLPRPRAGEEPFAAPQEPTPLRTAEEIRAERAAIEVPPEVPPVERPAVEPVPLETVAEKLKKSLAERDNRMAAEAIAEALESGAAQGEPVPVTRKMVEAQLGIGKEPTTTAAAEKTIFNELWDAEIQRQGVGRFSQAAEGLTQALENLRVDVDPGLGANPIPQLLGTSWNGALVVAQSMIKGGAKLADAIEKAVRYVRYDFKGKFDEAVLRKELETALTPLTTQGAPERQAAPTPGSQLRIATQQGMRPRRVAERIVASENIPLEVREAVAKSPGATYAQQNVRSVVDAVSKMSEDQLVSDLANQESNTRVASGVDLFNRMIGDGRMQQATDLAVSLAKSGTTWGQLINQFKLLKASTPDGIAILVTEAANKLGRKISPELLQKVKVQMGDFAEAKVNLDRIETALRDAVEADAPQSTLDFLYDQRGELVAKFDDTNVALNDVIAKANPALAGDLFISTVQGAVMAPLSIARNVIGNVINYPAREFADVAASVMDALVSGNKNNTYDLSARTVDRVKAFASALPQAAKVMLKGSDAMPYEIGKDIGNPLNFQRGWRNLFESLNPESGGRSARKILRDGYEATIGIYPDILLRLASATDIPFKAAQRASVITELGRKAGLTEKQIELAKKNIDLVKITEDQAKAGKSGLTPEQIENIEFEAARAVYQQDNAATLAVGNVNRWIKDKLGPGGYVPYRMLTLFQKTPINILGEVLSFTPMAGALRLTKEITPRERNILLGKQVIGLAAITAFDYLYDKGILSPALDTPQDTEKARQLSLSSGAQPPASLNLSGLSRLSKGQDPSFKAGDTVVDLNNIGLAGALGQMVGTARRIKEQGRTDENDLMAVGWGGVVGQLNFIMNQSLLKGASDFIGLLNSDPRNSFQNFAKGMLVTAGSPFAPNILASIDRANREFMPVIKDETFVKSAVNEFNRRLNVIGLQIPGSPAADKLPLKRDLWGEGVPQTPPGENPWIYNLMDPIRTKSIPADPLNADIYRLWRKTGNQAAIPSIPSPKLEYGGVEYDRLTPQQYDRFAQLVGFFRRTQAEKVYMTGAFANADSDRRIDMLGKAYSMGLRQGKHQFIKELRESGQSLKPLAPKRGFQQQ